MRPFARAAAVLVVLLVLSGCSDDGAAPSPSGPADAPAAGTQAGMPIGGYAGDFDAVTDQFRSRSEELQSRVDTSTTDVDRIISFYEELRAIAADARQQYGGLNAPQPVQSVHQKILQLFDRQVALLDEVVSAARGADDAALAAAVQGLVDLTTDFDLARREMQSAIATCGAPCVT